MSSRAASECTLAPLLEEPALQPTTLPGVGYARALLTPSLACAFLTLRPSAWWALLGFALLPFALDVLGEVGGEETRQPAAGQARWPFELILYTQFALHWANLILGLQLVAEAGWWSPHAPVVVLYLLLAQGLTGAVTGHELFHSHLRHRRLMGRLLYCSFLHEHWCTDHLWCHHARYGTREDPSTARFGESLFAYLVRLLPSQLLSSWRLERARHRDRGWAGRLARNWVLQGLGLEALLVAGTWLAFGWAGLALFVLQAFAVTVLLHVVNYFEHWGLERRPGERIPLAWGCTKRSTLLSMVGLVRHADHHLHPARPYQELRHLHETPKLPRGYGGMIALAVLRNRRFRELMTEELKRRDLLPLDARA